MLKWYVHLLSWAICNLGDFSRIRVTRTGVSYHLRLGFDAEDKLPLHQFPHLKWGEVRWDLWVTVGRGVAHTCPMAI